MSRQLCIICCNDLKYRTLTPCNHDDVCGVCHLRLRYLLDDKKCPMCKQANEQVIVDESVEAKSNFDAYPIWGNELGQGFRWREDVGMFFPTPYYETEILPLFGYQCTVCDDYDGNTPDAPPSLLEEEGDNKNNNNNKKKRGKKNNNNKPITPIRSLQDHLRSKHRLQLCNLCVENKRDFVSELPRLAPSQLQQHLTKGDGYGSGFSGHPVCEFCRPKRFYDLQHLYAHLAKEHFKCHVCDRRGIPNQYFRNYTALEKHFDTQHFLCHEPLCLEQKFVVFENEIDLRAHQLSIHGGGGGTGGTSTKINLQFNYRRPGTSSDNASARYHSNQEVPSNQDFQYGLDGQVFDPEAEAAQQRPQGEVEPNEETAHPLHLLRTQEIRAAAMAIRESQGLTSQRPEAFPSLGGPSTEVAAAAAAAAAAPNNSALRMGWTSEATRNKIRQPGGVRANDREAFPSLPTNNNAKKKKNPGTLHVLGPRPTTSSATSRAMLAAANAPPSSSTNWSRAAATSSSGPSRTSVPAPVAPLAVASASRAPNLTPDNFPSLGGSSSSSRSTYQAAENYARQQRGLLKSNNPSNLAASNFPTLGGSTTTTTTTTTAAARPTAAPAAAKKKQAPQTNNIQQFPGLPSSGSSNYNSVRDKVMAPKKSADALSLQRGMASVQDIKSILGPDKFKQLKDATKEFANGHLSPEAYVDSAASIFEDDNSNFWTFLPSLITSSPASPTDSNRALRYMDEMRLASATQASMMATSSSFSSSGLSSSSLKKPPQPKNNAWGSGGASTLVARAKPGSVTAAVATQQANKSKSSSNKGGNKKKSKQRDELRSLAGFR